jgi:hypothetical protein
LSHPSEKYDFVSWDDDIPNIWKNKKWSKPPTRIIFDDIDLISDFHGQTTMPFLFKKTNKSWNILNITGKAWQFHETTTDFP